MGRLQNFENKLEQAISGVFARAFRSAVQPVEISAALQREVDNNAQILSRDRRLVPNDFHVELSPSDLERLAPYDSAMARELTDTLRQHAEQQSYVFPGPVSIAFEAAEDLTTGRFRIRSRAQAKVTGRDDVPADGYDERGGHPGQGGYGQSRTARAVLEVNGTRHALRAPGLVVGRGTDADVRINDPGISRRHIEFRVGEGRADQGSPLHLSVRDLGSTNGMTVDGVRVAQSPLGHGSTVKIGNTTMTVTVEDGPRV
ncbi:DUF3662 and FHA domain-containing protein [Nocardioides sp. CFH 31398]|uniref:FhaA domain-containing protein n=1 Tax=Nocardioides sp. CFH 31398 TaxID=2919579 RepID=UPI001F05BA18|nr:DUF3662 and FHA domain-containing protein [Nocardioides sp. CFH 31398]MCH1865666.1 FHA domain-containing protein [Nocardioides sp. CFH 31398]